MFDGQTGHPSPQPFDLRLSRDRTGHWAEAGCVVGRRGRGGPHEVKDSY